MTSLKAARISLAIVCVVCASVALAVAAVYYRAELSPGGTPSVPAVKLKVAVGLTDGERAALDRMLGSIALGALPDAPRGQHPAFEFGTGGKSPSVEFRFRQIRADMEAQRSDQNKSDKAADILRRLQELGEPAGYRAPRFYRALALSWAGNPKEALGMLDSFRSRSAVGSALQIAAMKEYVAFLRALMEFQARNDLGRYLADLEGSWQRVSTDTRILGGIEGLVEPGELRTELLVARVRHAAAEKSTRDRDRAYDSVGAAWKTADPAVSKVQSDASARREALARCALKLRREDFADFADSSCEQELFEQRETYDMVRFRRSARDGRLEASNSRLGDRFHVYRIALAEFFNQGATRAEQDQIAGYLLRHPATPWHTKVRLRTAAASAVGGLVLLALVILGFWAFLDSEMRRVFSGAPKLDEQV